jgi:hypothetical protein
MILGDHLFISPMRDAVIIPSKSDHTKIVVEFALRSGTLADNHER